MPGVVEYLRRFNRKERFHLIAMALGNQDFRLGDEFRRQLDKTFGLSVPEECFVAMDYHLDWLYGSMFLAGQAAQADRYERPLGQELTHTQEDIDLVVAYEDQSVTHLILLEAKGDTPLSNGQLRSKADRLAQIFGQDGRNWPGVEPHFALVSPLAPKGLRSADWPFWMRQNDAPLWFPLSWPPGMMRMQRCDADGRADRNGNHWQLMPTHVIAIVPSGAEEND